MLANPSCIAVYRLSARVAMPFDLKSRRLRPCWEHHYSNCEITSRPPLGPVVVNPSNGERSISVCGGSFVRCVFMASGPRPQFRLSKGLLVHRIPTYLGITTGLRVGLYRRPYLSPRFTTFRLGDRVVDLHPISHESERYAKDTGSISFHSGLGEILEPGLLQIDEGEGRVVFVLRKIARRTARVVVLQLV